MKNRNLLLICIVALFGACSTPAATDITEADLSQDDQASADGVAVIDVVVFPDAHKDTSVPDEIVELDTPDSGSDVMQPQCQPGEGCFLDNCDTNSDCLSGWCVEHLGEALCSQSCQDECPPGWSCQQVAGTEPDVVFICVSDFANLCKPCSGNADCGTVGKQDVCVPYGDEGSFCGGGCDEKGNGNECPWGFVCEESETAEGAISWQCVAEAGVCPCTDKSALLGLSTPCAIENDVGLCVGHRVCTAEGLSACDALMPVVESCNGIDDDCNGKADEGTCDDGVDCTLDTCDPESGCHHEPLENGECLDGNPCTVADHCVAGECTGSPVLCDDSNPCTDDGCDELGGCIFTPNMSSCDDGNPCTTGDHCEATVCSGFDIECGCQSDDDCAPLENGDICDGTLFCDTSSLPYECAVLPDSGVECPPAEGIHAVCLAAACAPDTGTCSLVPDHEGLSCDDQDACTIGEVCAAGVCGDGAPLNCNDGNLCTDDSCDGESGCVAVNNMAPCQDGSVCTVNDSCLDGVCQPGLPMACNDQNPCTDDTCDGAFGCQFEANNSDCSDANPCTSGDHCEGGLCVAAEMLDCDDDNPCTDDSCSAQQGCLHQLNLNPCDDGNECTINDHCSNGWCLGSLANCNDFNVCTDDSCEPDTGCLHAPNQELCNDGSLCSVGDHCAEGECVGLEELQCDDGNLCSDDTCNPVLGCVHKLNSTPCDDGDACTVNDFCQQGACSGGGVTECTDDIECTVDSCLPDSGCQHLPDDNGCDDSDACTDDACDVQNGCVHSLNSGPCEDGNPCTSGEQCQAGLCQGGVEADCEDDNVCTEDTCDGLAGCLHTPVAGDCDDSDPCTANDYCHLGECNGGGEVLCDDNVGCTEDTCTAEAGCVYTPSDDSCDDLNECTDDGCDPDDGCLNTPLEGPCEGGQCEAGICVLDCVPQCDAQECGSDGCSGVCGTCGNGETCVGGSCIETGSNECNDGNDILWDGCTNGSLSEFRVNTFTPGQQTLPDVAGLTNGRYVIVWASYDQDGSNYGVYGQLHNAAGGYLGDEFQVNTYTTSSQANPRVAALDNGHFVVTWVSSGQISSNDIYGRRYDENAAPIGGELSLNATTNSTQDQVSVSGRTDGTYVSVWRGYPDGGGYGIFTRPFAADDAPLTGDINTATQVQHNQYSPDVATTTSGSIVVWESNGQDGDGYGIYGQRFDLAGSKSGSEFKVHTYTPNHQYNARVAAHEDGSFTIVWQSENEDGSGRGVYCQRFDAQGVKKNNPFRVNTYIVNTQDEPDISGWADGRFVVVWYSYGQDGENGGIFGQRFNADGTPAGSEFQVNSYIAYEQNYPAVATIPGAGFVVAWNSQAQDDSVSGVFAQRYDAVGNKLFQ